MHIVLFRKRNEKYSFKGQKTMDRSPPALHEGHWAVVRALCANGKWQMAEDRGPLSSNRGPRTVDIFRLEVQQVHRPMF